MDLPATMHVPTEFATRVTLWQNGHFEALLARLEAQAALRRAPRRKGKKLVEKEREGTQRRGRRQCAEGAYRKAVTTCSSEASPLPPLPGTSSMLRNPLVTPSTSQGSLLWDSQLRDVLVATVTPSWVPRPQNLCQVAPSPLRIGPGSLVSTRTPRGSFGP